MDYTKEEKEITSYEMVEDDSSSQSKVKNKRHCHLSRDQECSGISMLYSAAER